MLKIACAGIFLFFFAITSAFSATNPDCSPLVSAVVWQGEKGPLVTFQYRPDPLINPKGIILQNSIHLNRLQLRVVFEESTCIERYNEDRYIVVVGNEGIKRQWEEVFNKARMEWLQLSKKQRHDVLPRYDPEKRQ